VKKQKKGSIFTVLFTQKEKMEKERLERERLEKEAVEEVEDISRLDCFKKN
jgi:hypothetical protein